MILYKVFLSDESEKHNTENEDYRLSGSEYLYTASVSANEPHFLASPVKTNSTKITVHNRGEQEIECCLYDTNNLSSPIKTIKIKPNTCGVFGELTAALLYRLSFTSNSAQIEIAVTD